jgi:NosR/NirI family nitrous oxide reductase transcriptional regulator
MIMTEPSGRKAQGNHLCLGRKPTVGANFLWLAVIPWALYLGLATAPAMAAEKDGFRAFLAETPASEIFPGADRYGTAQGSPPAAAVFRGNEQIGYVFLNTDFFPSIGYSGKPIHVLLSIDMAGVIRGARLVKHSEPIVLIGIPERKITAVIDGYVGFNVPALLAGPGDHKVDIVSGATVTIMVIDDSILRSSIKVARKFGLGGLQPESSAPVGPKREIAPDMQPAVDWTGLMGDGSVRRLVISVGDVNRAFAASGDPEAAARPEQGDAGETFIDLNAALVSIPTIGRSLLGDDEYANLRKRLQPGQSAILVMGRGRYSFKGSGYVRGGIFDRFQLIQGETSIRFRDKYHKRLREIAAAGAPAFKEVGLFYTASEAAFNPAKPWRLELLVNRATGPTRKAYLTFDLGYQPPDKYLTTPVQPPAAGTPAPTQAGFDETGGLPLWQKLWLAKTWQIGILLTAISVLTAAFFFQVKLAHYPRFAEAFRTVFLIFTLFWIGYYANAQLSVVNVMTFFNAMRADFRWEYFLMEPLIFILWCSVAASLLFWGRGGYCGWLCPFGALQELTNKLAKVFKVPQITLPWGLHERIWPVKYMVFLALFGVSVYSLTLAEQLAEIEPFKTAIVLKFDRPWPYLLFVAALLAPGLFIERFYCRYFCVLGAALAIPGRLRMFEWLKRYKECGSPCQTCANECMVQAIHPEGHINPNECLYCMHCQILYHHEHRCPVVIKKRERRERRAALASDSMKRAKPTTEETGNTEMATKTKP